MVQAVESIPNASVDPRNALNDLTSKQWMRHSKSFWFQKGGPANEGPSRRALREVRALSRPRIPQLS